MQVYVNGKLFPRDEAKVSVFDHGFLYGDGVFEGIRVYDGNVFRLREHIDRLFESSHTIALNLPMSHEELMDATLQTIAANGKRDAYIRLVVSRGEGDLGIDPDKCKKGCTVVIIVDSIALYPEELYEKGIPIATSAIRRIPSECLDPRIKSLNYLNNILAKIDAKKAGVPEALMLNTRGFVAECTADNIFIVKNGGLKTPQLLHGALGGITRAAVGRHDDQRGAPRGSRSVQRRRVLPDRNRRRGHPGDRHRRAQGARRQARAQDQDAPRNVPRATNQGRSQGQLRHPARHRRLTVQGSGRT